MDKKLDGRRIAMLVANGFEESEMLQPKQALEAAGATVDLMSVKKKTSVRSWNHTEWGRGFDVDKQVADAKVSDYDALVLPGGVMNPDTLRMDTQAVDFVREACESGKPVAAICHGPWLLVEANVLQGRKVTSYPSVRTDIVNARGIWLDEPVVADGNFTTSRRPDDLPQFCQAIVERFSRPQPTRPEAARGLPGSATAVSH